MNTRPIISLFAMLTLTTIGATEVAKPILIGDGKDVVSSDIIGATQQLAKTVARSDVDVWMLRCDTYLSGQQKGHVFRVTVYFSPRVRTPRLIRGKAILCVDRTWLGGWNKDWPVFGDWASASEAPWEYAQVAPPREEFQENRLVENPFKIRGDLEDDDIIALADLIRQTAPHQELRHIDAKNGNSALASTNGEPGQGLHIDFEKTDSGWKEQARSRWVN